VVNRLFCYSLIFLLAARIAVAQGGVSISASTLKAAVNESFYITISASGSEVKEPDLSPWHRLGFKTGAPATQSSTSIQSINGNTTVVQSRSWRYPVAAGSPGTHTLPPLAVTVDGVQQMTRSLTLEISEKVSVSPEGRDGTPAQEVAVDDLVFVRAIADKTTVYQGEPILLRLLIYVLDGRFVSLDTPRQLPLPETEGFFSGPQWQNTYNGEYNSAAYRITEFNQVLFPAMPGDLQIASWTWQGVVRWQEGRFRPQGATRLFSTHPIPVTVLPLPEGAPAGFSGAVGKFRMQAYLSSASVAQGTPVRLTVSITGEGNPQAIGMPLFEKPSWAHVSEPESEVKQTEGSLEVTKNYSYLITPLEAGEHVIPAVSFSYFAPILKNYKTETSQELKLTVSATGETGRIVAVGGSSDTARQKIEINSSGELPLITDSRLTALTVRPPAHILSMPALLSPVISAVMLVAAVLFLLRRKRLATDTRYARRIQARGKCLALLQDAKEKGDKSAGIYQALSAFVADMLHINGSGLTSGEIQHLLQEARLNQESIDMTVRVLRACERAAYGGGKGSEEELTVLMDSALHALDALHAAFLEEGK